VSGLFPDVLKNMQSDDLEQKKLVYLYLMNYAKSHPDLVRLLIPYVYLHPLPQKKRFFFLLPSLKQLSYSWS
jgi:hypothetical protein